jgi:hypothetical protein
MDLFICGHDVPSVQKKYLLRQTQRHTERALLFCAKTADLPTRILLIDQGSPFFDSLLEITVQLCDIFRAGLVVLTVARTEQEARQRQRRAREIVDGEISPHAALSPQGKEDSKVPMNFDFLAGAEARSAAANVARWRHCQLVVLEANAAWGRWLGFHSGWWITELLGSLSFLVIPGALGDIRSRSVPADSFNADSSLSARFMPRTRNDESAHRAF